MGLREPRGLLWGHWGRLGANAVPAAGGLAEEVDEKVLHAAFIPFGDITDIQIPLDYETGACRGSGGASRRLGGRPLSALCPQRSTAASPSWSSSWRR